MALEIGNKNIDRQANGDVLLDVVAFKRLD